MVGFSRLRLLDIFEGNCSKYMERNGEKQALSSTFGVLRIAQLFWLVQFLLQFFTGSEADFC